MDRQIVYPGQIPLDTDILQGQKNVLIGLAKLAQGILGNGPLLNQLACTPTAPASLQVQVGPGEIYQLVNLDGTAYGSLAADTAHQLLKQGVLMNAVTLSCPAPGTAGQSVNYLIEVGYLDTDGGNIVLPYYNSANPAQAFNGPNNQGTSQNTVRLGVCDVRVKAGTAATTGTQTTPAADAGYVGAYVVTVANGQATIIANNISVASGAPFITESLTQKISQAVADARYAKLSGAVFTGPVSWSKGAAIASAATLTPGTDGNYFHVTGTTTITAIANSAPSPLKLVFDGALTLTHNATTLILEGAANIQTAAGDTAEFFQDGAGNWRCTFYIRAISLPVGVIDRKTATVDVVNTVTLTDLYRFTVPANTLGTTKKLRLTFLGDILYNNNIADVIEIVGSFGGTIIFNNFYTIGALSPFRLALKIVVDIVAKGATNSQISNVEEIIGPINTAGASGGGGTVQRYSIGIVNALAEDTTVNKDLFVQVTWGTASVNNSCRRLVAMLELL